YNRQQFDLALSDFNKTIELNPNDADAYGNRGIVYTIKGEFFKAIIDTEKAADLYRKQENNAGYQKAQELLKLIRQEMNKN
ncbi:tetratricopeptide repeat protein, partial [Crocosphaera watsonii]